MADGPFEVRSDAGSLLGGNDLLARLDRWVSAARSDHAAAARSRERWLRQVADESASFTGVLVDLAERGAPVVVHGAAGRRHHGIVHGVGTDFVALRTAQGAAVLLALSSLAYVRPEASSSTALGDRDLDLAVGLAEALAALAEDRPRVLVVTTADCDGIAGELRAVGRDVVTLRLDGAPRAAAYVPLATIAEVRLA
ncbi:MAG: hypothetical protein ABIV94_03360 [Acidimicrobiales bacterium]